MSLLVMLYLVTVLQDNMVRRLNFAHLIVLKVLSIKDAILAVNKPQVSVRLERCLKRRKD